MFSREGKYGHTCVVALQNGSFVNGAQKIPVALLTSQRQKEVGHTMLLRFSKVVNLFHEFGHVDITKPIKDERCKALKRWRCSFLVLKLKQEILYCNSLLFLVWNWEFYSLN